MNYIENRAKKIDLNDKQLDILNISFQNKIILLHS